MVTFGKLINKFYNCCYVIIVSKIVNFLKIDTVIKVK